MARLNENENENEGTGGNRDSLFAGGRYNTYKIAKHAFTIPGGGNFPRVPRSAKYDEVGGWDAENKGWIYLVEFARLQPAWFEELRAVAAGAWNGWGDLSDQTNARKLDSALQEIVDAAGEREDRFAECFHQQDAEGCISYWTGMLGIDRTKHPNTYELIRFARKLGEMIVMCLKAHFNAPRPSQICPAIVPMFDPPRTATYPAGHSLQSYLMSYFLLRAMPLMPQSKKPEAELIEGKEVRPWEVNHVGLFALARRVADNRVIAGVHFDIDSEAGFLVAKKIDKWFDAWCQPTFADNNLRALVLAASNEFPQFKNA